MTWILSPGRPITRLMKSVLLSSGVLNTAMSPRFGGVPKTRPWKRSGLNGKEYFE